MEQKLEIKKEISGGSVKLFVSGRIDAFGANQLSDNLNELIHAGHYFIILNMQDIVYLSSAGIRIIVKYNSVLSKLNGSLIISFVSENIREIFDMMGLQSLLVSNKNIDSTLSETKEESETKIEGFSYTLRETYPRAVLKSKILGNPELLKTFDFAEKDCVSETLSENKYILGLGAIGADFNDCKNRFGEMIAISGAAAYLPSAGSNNPDYIMSSGKYVPDIKLLYGIVYEGEFSHIMSFRTDLKAGISLSRLIETAFKELKFDKIGAVIIAECSGLVGASLTMSPFSKEGFSPFGFPAVRESFNFSTERAFPNMLAVVSGVAAANPSESLGKIVRPIYAKSDIFAHFHSAVFPFRPIKKDVSDISEITKPLFEDDQIKSVIHLLNDEREISGVGESEFIQGICWIGKLDG